LKTVCFIEAMNHLSVFVEYRNYLFALAQRLLGSALDAEDLLQETFLRWQQTSLAQIRSPKAFLSTVLKRLCLNHLESAHVRHEESVDSVELETSAADVPPEQTANEGIAPALLILLERLSPKEQIVLLLRDVFDCDYDEIAQVLRNSTVACRQLLSRARQHLVEGHSRFAVSHEQLQRLVQQFIHTHTTGDLNGLVTILA
jgi:RNA polymerase sigma-70 factor (ECF subfamily)